MIEKEEMTSLAKQLQRLAVPHVQSVFAEDKRRKSLLFDPKEAASLDKETFYALGINGLDELQTLDGVFQQFETTLFAESSLTFERSIQTKEVNDKLDENISRFLSFLSPYCLLKPAHKALEWLIYRYHIHMYNVDDLMMCLLPYHESKIFVRAVQLLNLDSKTSSKWDWLDTIQMSGVHLSKSVLVNHCWTNTGFLSLLCDNVQKIVKIHLNENKNAQQLHVLFSFYATTVIGVIEFGKITENLISTLIPYISIGLRSKVMDYKAATYMILAQMFYKAKLKSELTTTLLNVLCKRLFAPLIKEATSCLLLMFQTQEVSKFTKKSFKYLCKHSGFVEAIISLSADFKADKLLVALFEKVIPAAVKQNADIASSGSEGSDSEYEGSLIQYPSMLYRLISNIHMSDHVAEEAARYLLKSYVNYRQTLQADETKLFNSQLRNVIRIMEGRYSFAVEKAIEEVLSEARSEKDRNIIKDFLNLSVLSVQYHMIADSDASLTLSLNHRLPVVRQSAVKHLLQFADTADDPSYLSESVLLRLRDDSPTVVEAVLQKPQILWNSFTDKKALLEGLDLVLMKADSKAEWQKVGELAIVALGECQVDEDMEPDVQSMLLPSLLILSDSVDRESQQVDQLLQSTFAKKNNLLSFVAKNWKGKGNLSPKKSNKADILSLNKKMVETIGKGLMEYRHKDRDTVIRKLCEKSSSQRPRYQCMILLILDQLISMTTGQTEKLDLCHLHLTLIKNVETSTFKENKSDILSLDECLLTTFKCLQDEGKLPSCLPVVMIHRLISGCSVPKQLLTGREFWEYKDDHSISDKYLNLCINMLDFIMENTTDECREFLKYRQLVLEFMQVFPDQKTLFKFLGLLWTQHCNDKNHGITSVLQARALQLGKVHIERLVNMEHQALTACIPTVLVSLMSVLTSKHQGLRQVAIDCLSSLMTSLDTIGSTFIPLVRKIIRCSQEIIEDPDYLTEVLKAFFKATGSIQDEDGKSPRKKAKHSGKKEAKQEALKSLTGIIVASETPDYIQRILLKMLQLHNNSDMLEELLPLLHKLLHHQKQHGQTNTTNFDCISLILARYMIDTASVLKSDSKGLELLLVAMTMKSSCEGRKQSVQELAINQISKDFYSVLESDSQQRYLQD
ncbi:hypothetical protein KUTeg_016117 [Tegillarca granosa]|uniref:HEAT repeat-containing protein 1 n=1 Tax=Tegillarca granosa TaxID=220873 RepID=A0ABQ9EJX1_TEGGR|nr:hypothetical protein KUTeg_016117 [Tegillarca granosa]